ncbi:MAG: hypothetical protein EPO08_09160 [Rhodospirillaceae bacterium]|nr:MAG: hypothetical protein EPO08_09160 [Rhodospirillaceae bacterium]
MKGLILGAVATLTVLVSVVDRCCAEDVSLYDGGGEAVAYIAVDDELTVYLWGGQPVAYLDDGSVWGFNGKHLGWFDGGVIWDHEGNGACALKGALTVIPRIESLKSLKSLKPLKSLKELPPLQALHTNHFSATPCSIFLALGQ